MTKRIIVVFAILAVGAVIGLSAPAVENEKAKESYQTVLETIKAIEGQLKLGNEAKACCLYEEAIKTLQGLRKSYPEWNKKAVARQIKDLLAKEKSLKMQACQRLGQMKEEDFRLQVLQQQQRILIELDRNTEKLDLISQSQTAKLDLMIQRQKDIYDWVEEINAEIGR